MRSGPRTRKLAVASASLTLTAALAVAAEIPHLAISAPKQGCPGVEGSFVAVLDPARGMLLLSAREFLGGHRLGQASGGPARLSPPDSGAWELAGVSSPAGPVDVFGAVYPFSGERPSGCVGFDRDRFSSEGDLVTYLRWVVEDIYLSLPAAERQRWPAFRIAGREVRLRVEGLGFQPLPLAGKEGAAIAFRLPGVDRTFLLTPFVIDEASRRVAAQVASTVAAFWASGEKKPLGWVVSSAAESGTLADPPLTIVVLGVGEPAAAAGAAR